METPKRVLVDEAHSRLFLLAILLSGVVTMLNTSTVTISLPTYMNVFHVDINTVQWVVIGYMLPLGMVMPLSEYLCERFSYKKVFLTAMGALGICSLGCALSFNFLMLVIFRFLKGICGGIIIPCTMAMIYRYAPRGKQAEFLGTSMLYQSFGTALGPTIAGLLLQVSSWHVLFLINLPFVLLVIWAARKSVPAEAINENVEKIDFWGCGQVSLGSGLIMLAFSMGDTWGWKSLTFWSCVIIGAFLVVIFVVRQFHTTHPLLNFGVLKFKAFSFAMLLQCVIALTLGINAILSQFYFQTGLELSPATTGLLLMGPSLMMLAGNWTTTHLHKKGFMKSLITFGLLCALIGNLGLCNLTLESNLVFVMCCFGMRFFGISMAQMPLTNYGLSAVPRELSGHASSLFNWGRQLTQTVSTNILTVLLSMNLTRYYLEAGHSGSPVEGTLDYRLAAVEAVNTDYLYIAAFLVLSLMCTFFIQPQKGKTK